ncbi:MAG: topoisomerase [Candidatus Saccharibacteria bacterium]|nr:topoisomerase [Candidatus Saccharibacteria bacterium]
MEANYVIIAALIVFVIYILAKLSTLTTQKRKVFKNNTYSYIAKDLVMTRTEAEFFKKLDRAVGERYFVFPQIHLSSLLDHHVKGQEWRYAFSHINGKSVDYVLCNKTTLRPTYAIELDDYTHDTPTRRERDLEVERILEEANFPLVRFRNKNVSEADIIHTLMNAANWK